MMDIISKEPEFSPLNDEDFDNLESAPLGRYGATPEEWKHFADKLGLVEDMLPVVSNPNATISKLSKMKGVGKTPSKYYRGRVVGGIKGWTEHRTTREQVRAWSQEPDYGLCVQTRTIRAIDVDITDEGLAAQIEMVVRKHVPDAPKRMRADSSKFLVPIRIGGGGDYSKRILKTPHGNIEFLATGQQFIAAGLHPSGSRYQWEGGLPTEIPQVSPEEFEKLWATLEKKFGVEPSVEAKKAGPKPQMHSAALDEQIANSQKARFLRDHDLILGADERNGKLHIACPFVDGHSGGEDGDTSTTFLLPTPDGRGDVIDCKHASCAEHSEDEFWDKLGYDEVDEDFEVVADDDVDPSAPLKYRFETSGEFMQRPPLQWFVKGRLPKAALATVFGPPGGGKSFWVLDLVLSIARGEEYDGCKVKQGAVAYVVAEGVDGFSQRLAAYSKAFDVNLDDVPLRVLPSAFNILSRADTLEVIKGIRAFDEPPVVVVVDTLAQVLAGGDENDSKAMGKMLSHCRLIYEATGAMVVLIHHSGKDTSKGARGHSSLWGASDVMFKITDFHGHRTANIFKLKDGKDQVDINFVLDDVKIGVDEDGEPVTSCVVRHVAGKAKGPQQGSERPLKVNEVLVMKVLKEELVLADSVDVGVLIDLAVDQLTPPDKPKRDNRRRDVGRAIDSLSARDYLRIDGGQVTLGEGVAW